MSFNGEKFIYDGKSSEIYNLYISSPDGGEASTPGGSEIEIFEQKIYRRAKPFLLGVQLSPTLEIEVTMTSPDYITEEQASVIKRWLFGRKQYARLQIVQPDLQNVYMNVLFKSHRVLRVGNAIIGFSATAKLDAPYGWKFPRTTTYTPLSSSIVFNNQSDDNDYLYPLVAFTMDGSGGNFSITNTSDNNRVFAFTGLSAGEIISCNNDLKIITSSLSLRRLSSFNKHWFRFVPGVNYLTLSGNANSLSFTYSFAKNIGG
jgi:phage-related protein